ncbi:MAG: tetratricopeptide repeat protein [Acidobacteriaceae bacterium]|nr:tetratricopeptide repeat protein [Acidobacteriaceae bacterium]
MTKYRSLFVLIAAFSIASAAASQTPQTQTPPPDQHRDLEVVTAPTSTPKPPTPANVVIPRSYALVIGISRYKNLPERSQLKFSDRDADAIYTALISKEGGEFPAENVHVLKDGDATLANVKDQLENWLPSVSKDDDRVLIYFAGHGFLNGGQSYLAPSDIDPNNIANTAYPMSRLGDVIGNKIHAKWKVLLADACHSGAITPEADRAQVNQSLLDLNKSLFVVTASRDREQSFEGPGWGGGHGIFTYYAVKAIQGEADTSGDGVVTAQELGDYVYTNVAQASGQRQHPTFDRGSFDTNMVLAYNPDRTRAANLPAPKFGTLIIETNMDGVEVIVDGKSVGVVNKASALRLPGLQPGIHTIQGNREGYEPDGPREEEIYPGQDTTISVRILILRTRKKAAVDNFNRGLELYNKGYEQNYKAAVTEFKNALQIEPTYSQAALFLGRTYRSLYDYDAANEYFKQAIQIDPDYLDARLSYAGGLLDTGDFDEAIRQLNFVSQRDANNGTAWYLLSQAFFRKGAYDQAVRASREAVKLIPNKAESHLWLADSLRLYDDSSHTASDIPQAETEYQRYLTLSDFDSKLAGKLNYYVLPWLIGTGTKKRAAQTDIWKQMRAQANFGICDCEWLQKRYDSAIPYCERALALDSQDLYAQYRLGILYSQKFNVLNEHSTVPNGLDLLVEAREHFTTVIALNSAADQATNSRKYIQNIDQFLGQQP